MPSHGYGAPDKVAYKLFVTFVDFSKVYDLAPCNMLFMILKRMSCGKIMLAMVSACRVPRLQAPYTSFDG